MQCPCSTQVKFFQPPKPGTGTATAPREVQRFLPRIKENSSFLHWSCKELSIELRPKNGCVFPEPSSNFSDCGRDRPKMSKLQEEAIQCELLKLFHF